MVNGKAVSVIIAAAGSGSRMGEGKNKQYIELRGMPILARSIRAFEKNSYIDHIVVSVRESEVNECKMNIVEKYHFNKVKSIVIGGAMRQDSVYMALKAIDEDTHYVLIHDGARPFVSQGEINDVLHKITEHGAGGLAVPVKDTIKVVSKGLIDHTPNRDFLYAMQTPQGFEKNLILQAFEKAYQDGYYGTDETMLLERMDKKVAIVPGRYENIKITTPEDLAIGHCIAESLDEEIERQLHINHSSDVRTGIGYDVHRLVTNRKLIIGGVEINHELGLLGHSDADVLLHAIMDAILGACGMGDIGKHFPDSDEQFKNISSMYLLTQVHKKITQNNFIINHIDATIIAQKPKFSGYIPKMIENIAAAINIQPDKINIKATTTEGLGFEGRCEGISAQAVATISRYEIG